MCGGDPNRCVLAHSEGRGWACTNVMRHSLITSVMIVFDLLIKYKNTCSVKGMAAFICLSRRPRVPPTRKVERVCRGPFVDLLI